MALVQQAAGQINMKFYARYPFAATITFNDKDLTGYQMEAYIENIHDQRIVDFDINAIDLTTGQLELVLSERKSQQLSKKVSYQWVFNWIPPGGVVARVLAGRVVIV